MTDKAKDAYIKKLQSEVLKYQELGNKIHDDCFKAHNLLSRIWAYYGIHGDISAEQLQEMEQFLP